MINVRRGDAFAMEIAVYVDGVIDVKTTGGSGYEANLRTQSDHVARTIEAAAAPGVGVSVLDSNGTGAWPIGEVFVHVRWTDTDGTARALFTPLRIRVVEASEEHVVTMKSPAYADLGAGGSLLRLAQVVT